MYNQRSSTNNALSSDTDKAFVKRLGPTLLPTDTEKRRKSVDQVNRRYALGEVKVCSSSEYPRNAP